MELIRYRVNVFTYTIIEQVFVRETKTMLFRPGVGREIGEKKNGSVIWYETREEAQAVIDGILAGNRKRLRAATLRQMSQELYDAVVEMYGLLDGAPSVERAAQIAALIEKGK